MRVCLALTTVLLLALITTIDRVACQDGCTDPVDHRTQSEAPSTCGLCHGWSGPSVETPSAPVMTPVEWASVPEDVAHTAHLPAIEHPPRFA